MAEPEINVVGLSSSKSKSKTNWKVISAIIGIIVLSLGIIAGILLVRQNQDVREKAACSAQCPAGNGNLINCYNTEDTDGEESICNSAGRIEVCGTNSSDARQFCCPAAGGSWTTNLSLCNIASTPTATATATSTSSVRPDYCVSASADKAVLNTNDTLTVSSVSNTPVNGFAYAVYNLDNLYGPGNAKPVCTGVGNVTSDCPNGGTHLILPDPDTSTLRTNGSAQVTYGRLFITDKSTGQQLKNAYFMAYFSLNGGQVSWPQDACKAFTRMASVSATATSTASASGTASSTKTATASATSTSSAKSTPTSTSQATATAVPIPVTGASWPTILGTGFGLIMILVSVVLAL